VNYYRHHIGDYLVETSHLTFVEDAAYSRLLRLYYHREAPFPADVAAVQRLSGARGKAEKTAVEIVLNEFFQMQEDGWHHMQADDTIAKYHDDADTSRENGKKGGRPKAGGIPERTRTKPGNNPEQTRTKPGNNPEQTRTKPGNNPEQTRTKPGNNPEQTRTKPSNNPEQTRTKPSNNPEQTQTKANQEPITNNQEPITNNQEPIKAKAKAKTSHATREREDAKPDDNPEQTRTKPDDNPEQTRTKPKSSRKREDCTLQQALDDNVAATGGERFIRDDDPVFAWAEKIGLPLPFLELGWEEFVRRFLHSRKRQKDWRAHFRNACRRDWLGVWKINSLGEFYLTQAGKQLERELDAEWEEQRAHALSLEAGERPEPEPPPDDDGFDNSQNVVAALFPEDPFAPGKWL